MFYEIAATKLRKTGVLVISLLILLAAGGTAWGEGEGGNPCKPNLITLCMIKLGTQPPVRESTFCPGDALSPQELKGITGKGLEGLRGTSQPGAAAHIVLWDEASLQRIPGVTFSNEGNSLANAQSNALFTGGR